MDTEFTYKEFRLTKNIKFGYRRYRHTYSPPELGKRWILFPFIQIDYGRKGR